MPRETKQREENRTQTDDLQRTENGQRIADDQQTQDQEICRTSRDSSNKIIFREPELVAQFLRDYTGIPMLKDVKAGDITDISERFIHLFAEDRESDTVKRIQISGKTPIFLISLIEHKTYIDYNITMQILRYMVYIWDDYAREMEQKKAAGESVLTAGRKGFQYPFILPIVYYEGKKRWTSSMTFGERVNTPQGLEQYIPDFSYLLVSLKDFSNEELLAKKDAISVVMMFNKLQDAADLEKIRQVSPEEIEEILRGVPDYLVNIISQVVETFAVKLNLPQEEVDDTVALIKERQMGYLFENMEKMDIQLERRQRKEAQAKAEEAQAKAEEAQAKAEEAQAKAEEVQAKAEEVQAKAEEAEKKAREAEKKAEAAEKAAEKAAEEAAKEATEKAEKQAAEQAEIKLISKVIKKMRQGKSVELIAEELDESLEEVGRIYQAEKETGLGDEEELYRYLR